MEEKQCENILLYDISHKTLIGAKPLRFIRVYDGTIYLVLFGLEKYDAIYNRIRYLKEVKSVITYVFCHDYARTKVDLYGLLTFHIVIIHIKLFLKDQNH